MRDFLTMRFFFATFAVVLITHAASAQKALSPPQTDPVSYSDYPKNLYRGGVLMIDLDGTDRMDLVLTGLLAPVQYGEVTPTARSSIFIHRTELRATDPFKFDTLRSFVEVPVSGFSGLYNTSLAAADYDNDGRPEVAVVGLKQSGTLSSPVSMLVEQLSNLEFEVRDPGWAAPRDGSLAWGDYNNDGRPDLLMTGRTFDSHITHLYENSGGGSFQLVDAGLPGIAFGEAVWGDSDNDGDLDVLLSGALTSGSFFSGVFLNDGGSFSDAGVELPPLAFGHARWVDLNEDGLLDILLSGAFQSPMILESELDVYENLGGNAFGLESRMKGHFDGDLDLLDWDTDGDVDIVVSGYPSLFTARDAEILTSEGGVFTPRHTVLHSLDMSFSPGDFDRDLDADLYATGFNPKSLGLVTPAATHWIKWGHFINMPPAAPVDLQSSASVGRVELSWSASQDDRTASPSLTYNIRVGTTPGGVDVMAPLANPATGRRFVCEPGNVYHNTGWHLEDLPAGTYYWSVQAIDQSCVGSDFESEATFTIPAFSVDREEEGPATTFSLGSAYPNPFSTQTSIEYEIPSAAGVRLEIVDVLGRRVRTVASGLRQAGRHTSTWDGRNDAGSQVAPGLYLVRLEAGASSATGTLLLTR